jgi:hypothetical protein
VKTPRERHSNDDEIVQIVDGAAALRPADN